MARESPLVAVGTKCRHRPAECTRRTTDAIRYRCLATRAEPSRGFAEGAKSVESSEELAPEKLDAVEPHALKRLVVGAHGGHQQHVPELPVPRPARACTIAVPGEDAVQVPERHLALSRCTVSSTRLPAHRLGASAEGCVVFSLCMMNSRAAILTGFSTDEKTRKSRVSLEMSPIRAAAGARKSCVRNYRTIPSCG